MFYVPSFKIYGSVAGFYDYGPPGCAIKQNLTQAWRQHFVLEENMLEVGARDVARGRLEAGAWHGGTCWRRGHGRGEHAGGGGQHVSRAAHTVVGGAAWGGVGIGEMRLCRGTVPRQAAQSLRHLAAAQCVPDSMATRARLTPSPVRRAPSAPPARRWSAPR